MFLFKLGTDTSSQLSFSRPTSLGLRLRQQKRSWPPSPCTNLAQQQEMLGILMDAKPQEASRSCTQTWDGELRPTSERSPTRHIQSMSRRASTTAYRTGLRAPQGFFRGQDWQTFRKLQSRPQRLHHLLEHTKDIRVAQPDPSRIPRSRPSSLEAITATINASGRSSLRRGAAPNLAPAMPRHSARRPDQVAGRR